MEKTLELRVRAIIGPEMAKLQQELRTAGLLGAQAGKTATASGREIEQSFQRGNRAAKDFNGTIQNSTKYLQLIKGVISAFLLYRGFSFLTQQASQFTRTLVDTQHEIGIIQTQLRETGRDHSGDLTRNIMRTAAETGMAMESLARTEYEIVSANIKVADSYRVLDLTARAAVAGGMKEAEVAFDAALSQVNAFGITFEKAFDLQFQTLKRGVFNYEQFTTVVGTLSEAFDSMDQKAETANASLAAISQVFTGKQIERGATGLRNAVLRISEAPEDFEKLGVSVTKTNGDFRNFLGIVEDLEKALANMSTSQRAAVLRDLFPDERERRGIGALLGQLDEAQQFFVEQQFAVGSLNDAYETANDSLLTQARIFEQNLTPAMEPFVKMMSGLLDVFNSMDRVLPGLNSTLLTTATVAAVVGGGTLLTGNRFPLSNAAFPVNASPMMRRYAGLPGARLPTGLGIGAASLVPITSFMSAQGGGAQAGDYLGSALGGALAGGTVGGLPGAAIGAAVGLAATAFGAALANEAEPVSRTFSEKFSDALKNNAGDVAKAFTHAIAVTAEIAPGVPLFKALSSGVSQRFQPKMEGNWFNEYISSASQAELDRAISQGQVSINRRNYAGFDPVAARFNEEERAAFYRNESVKIRSEHLLDLSAKKYGLDVDIPAAFARTQLTRGFASFTGRAQELAPFQSNENYAAGLQAVALESFQEVFGEQSPLASGAADFAVKMFESGKGVDVFVEALQAASSGDVKRFLELTGQLDDAAHEVITTFEVLAGRFAELFTGDADLAADVFERMGTEGERLAEVFRSVSSTMQAFSTLQTLQAMRFQQATTREESMSEYASRMGLSTSTDPIGRAIIETGYRAAQSRGELNTVPVTQDASLLESLGIDPNAAAQSLIDRLVSDLGLVKGSFTTEQFIEALLQEPEKIQEPLELSSNDFADALFLAADKVRSGVLPGVVYTADQLEMFAEEFQVLNRTVRQKALLEQLQGIAEFAGVDDTGLKGAMDILRKDMVSSGKALFDLLSDPASLAELIAKMEFGDIEVDNSTNNNFVIRISEGVSSDPAELARIADLLVQEVDKRHRRRVPM